MFSRIIRSSLVVDDIVSRVISRRKPEWQVFVGLNMQLMK